MEEEEYGIYAEKYLYWYFIRQKNGQAIGYFRQSDVSAITKMNGYVQIETKQGGFFWVTDIRERP